MQGQQIGGEGQKCGSCVEARQKEQEGLCCNVFIIQFCRKEYQFLEASNVLVIIIEIKRNFIRTVAG
jgi:hypothetical protein